MGYRIEQAEQYRGHNYWNWQAWIESAPEELDQIESVVWILHPTFKVSRVTKRSKDNKFRLEASGWGMFLIRAELILKSEDRINLSRMLKLTIPDDQEEIQSISTNPVKTMANKKPTGNAPTIFLSYSSEDESQAHEIRQTIESLGARVLDARSISAGLPLSAAITKLIRESDAVIGVIGSEYPSPYVIDEMKKATIQDKPVVTLLTENIESPSNLVPDIQMLRVGPDKDQTNSILARFVGKLRTTSD
jgi:hypothetical protein